MNLSELRGEVRRYLAETSATASYFSNEDINRSINEGLKVMCEKGGVLEKSQALTVATTDASYTLPWDFIPIEDAGIKYTLSVHNHNTELLDAIHSSGKGRTFIRAGYPLYYYISREVVTIPTWQVATGYVVWPATHLLALTYARPTTANGYTYECTTAGTSAPAVEPTWPTVVGSTVTDNTVTWTCRELVTGLYNINFVDTPTTAGGGAGSYTYIYRAMEGGLYTDTASPSIPLGKHIYLVIFACYRCAIKAKNYELASSYLKEFMAGTGLSLPLEQASLQRQSPSTPTGT